MNMSAREVMTVSPACCRSDTTLDQVARLMVQHDCGEIPVVDESDKVIGVVTDRDIVIGVVATDLAPNTLTVGDIMGTELATAQESEDVFDAVQRMRNKGVRRMPIVDANNDLVGIVSIDDIIEILAEEMYQLAHLISREQINERDARR